MLNSSHLHVHSESTIQEEEGQIHRLYPISDEASISKQNWPDSEQ